ncbi:MAG: hypothetical protein RLZZ228_1752 [Actinomycetota bacterium]
MKLRRPILAASVSVLSVLALAACEKPAPGVSVVSGMTSAYRAALCWSFDGEPLSAETCAQDVVTEALDGADVARVPVIPGQVIGISVDPVVADAGWFPVIGSQRLTQQPITSTYYRFTYPDLQEVPADGVSLQVVAGADGTLGLWIFQLIPSPGVE